MTGVEMNKRLCELLGICWHEWVDNVGHQSCNHPKMCKHCWSYPVEVDENPDFVSPAGRIDLLRRMRERLSEKKFDNFLKNMTGGICSPERTILVTYILDDPGAIARAALEFLEKEANHERRTPQVVD